MTTFLVYGLAEGVTEDWREEILSSHCHTQADIQAITDRASLDGWHSFRIALYDETIAPDFTKVVNL